MLSTLKQLADDARAAWARGFRPRQGWYATWIDGRPYCCALGAAYFQQSGLDPETMTLCDIPGATRVRDACMDKYHLTDSIAAGIVAGFDEGPPSRLESSDFKEGYAVGYELAKEQRLTNEY